MKKVLLTILAFLLPFTAFAATAIPWQITNLTDAFIKPVLVNGNTKGVIVSATSTIGDGTATGGLTINGSGTSTNFTVTSIAANGTAPLFPIYPIPYASASGKLNSDPSYFGYDPASHAVYVNAADAISPNGLTFMEVFHDSDITEPHGNNDIGYPILTLTSYRGTYAASTNNTPGDILGETRGIGVINSSYTGISLAGSTFTTFGGVQFQVASTSASTTDPGGQINFNVRPDGYAVGNAPYTAVATVPTVATINQKGMFGISTTTPAYMLQVASSSAATTFRPQFAITDTSSITNNHWTLQNVNGNLYLATTSPTTFATSSFPAFTGIFQIDSAGNLYFGTTSPPSAPGTLPYNAATTGAVGTTSFSSNLNVNNGITYSTVTGSTSVSNLVVGPLSTKADAGQVTLATLPQSASTVNSVESFGINIGTSTVARFKAFVPGGSLNVGSVGASTTMMEIATTTASTSPAAAPAVLSLGTSGSNNGTSTVMMGKLQFDFYNSAGTRSCGYVLGTTWVISAGACTP